MISLYFTYGTSGSVQNEPISPIKSVPLDTTQYHTYRVVVHSDFTYDLYVDGSLAWNNAPNRGSGSNIFKIGGDNSGYTADFDLDWIKMASGEWTP